MRPYTVAFPASVIDDLRDRLARTRWPAELPDVGWTQGVPLETLRELATYWRTSYDWRAHEAVLNRLPNYVTEVDGQPLHFIHSRSSDVDALALLVLFGWFGSIVE